MNRYEQTVLNHFFSNYPEDSTYKEITDYLETENLNESTLVVWEPFSRMSGTELVESMEGMREDLEKFFIERG